MGGIAQRKLMKDRLDSGAIARLGANVARAWPAFDAAAFTRTAERGLAPLELKQRVSHVTTVLADHLPADPAAAIRILVRAGKTWDRGDARDPLRGFAAWPVFEYIETRGGSHFDASMAALRELTHLFSAEFAVRPFIASEPDRAFAYLEAWTQDDSEQVRRLASEGARPRLPWARRLPALQRDPTRLLALLERLRDDPSPFVRRSVANNLADIAVDHPDRVVAVCKRWLRGASDERAWIVRRATRNLVKAGHPAVWSLLGYTESPAIAIDDLVVAPAEVTLGDDLRLAFRVTSTAAVHQRIVVDYAVSHVRANGTRAPKVFKLRDLELAPGATVAIEKRHPFRRITTRRYYAGVHRVDVLVNGVVQTGAEFCLRV